MRCRGFAEVDRRGQVTHTHSPVQQGNEDSDAARLTQQAEDVRKVRDVGLGRHGRSDGGDVGGVNHGGHTLSRYVRGTLPARLALGLYHLHQSTQPIWALDRPGGGVRFLPPGALIPRE